jgi:hypothetical protein
LGEIHRVLRLGGRLYAATNGTGNLQDLYRIRRLFDPTAHAPDSLFTLNNGTEQLTPFFSDVRLDRYADSLEVTEVEPIMAHLLSADASGILANRYAEVEAYVRLQLRERGNLVFTKDVGLFEASRAGKRLSRSAASDDPQNHGCLIQ